MHRFSFFFFFSMLMMNATHSQRLVAFEGQAQGTYYIVKYLSDDTATLQPAVEQLFTDIDHSLSLWDPHSLINQFNNNDRGVPMDAHMRYVLEKSLAVSAQTNGAFDITVKPLVDLWGFGVVRHQRKPTTDSIRKALRVTGYKLLQLKGDSLLKRKPGVQIDCNGVAQGYTTDCVARLLEQRGIQHYLVDVGGELRAKGVNAKGKPWSVGVERPSGNTSLPAQSLVYLKNNAVATSGNYRRFFDEGKTRYAHTINPQTGIALHSNVISVTVVADDCITADAFDNALILWGPVKGLQFIRQHPGLHLAACYIFTDKAGKTQEVFTEGFFDK
ncbi:FAD:protein FMN transferase [Chitinophaga sedimenti]|uniref:FAD:protein FMN transferase n=1 Tax=Chitinophaga sedimenti TaxID=2033606 RepID=UPI0020060A7D|nr:FAD:protein FMN transferase [Chitinophaga sedimenti]MCK7553543.1 FAD:protein FMN transferase [Chitinophaga sedimenti]